mgnify:FL=1
MIYANGGYYHTYGEDPLNPTSILYKDAGYEGVRSFAIVTTKVTDEILQYWLDQKDKTDSNGTLLYANGPMKAAYGTFLTSLMMIKCHDMIADQAAVQYNIIWARTTPIVVSVFDDAYRTVMTLECDHRFGMDVTGDVNNITAFRYACSSAINPLEHYVMKTLFPGGNGTSIVMGLGMELFNGQMPGIFISNGYMVMRSVDNGLFLIFDPETSILRDIMLLNSTISGEYCFSDLQAEWASDLGERLLNNPPVWLGLIGSTVTVGGSSFLGIGRVLANPVVLTVALGLVTGYAIFQYCVDQGWLPPERCREIIGISPPFAILNKLLYNEEPLFGLNKLNKEEAVIYGPILKKRLSDVTAGQVPLDGPKGDKAAFLRNLYNEAIGWIKDGISDISAGNSATGTAKIALYSTGAAKITVGTGGIYFWGSYFAMELLPDKAKEQILKLIS